MKKYCNQCAFYVVGEFFSSCRNANVMRVIWNPDRFPVCEYYNPNYDCEHHETWDEYRVRLRK